MSWCPECDYRSDNDWDICPKCNSPRKTPHFMGAVMDFHDTLKNFLDQEELVQKGNHAYDNEDWEEAKRHYLAAIQATRKREVSIESELLVSLAEIATHQGEMIEAEELYKENVDFSRNTGNYQSLVNALIFLADFQENELQELDEAKKSYKQVLSLKKEAGDKIGQVSTLISLGHVSRKQGELDEGLDFYKKGLKISIDNSDRKNESIIYYNQGAVYQSKNELEKAQDMLSKSISISKEIGYLEGEAHALHFLGDIMVKMDNQEEADKLYRKSSALFSKIESEEK